MTYEPGVLVRRQQREYPQELRAEIALAALEVGNNREVARLYSERLGYTVNESTVRGIKKRYLEGVHKGKINSPGVSPRASGGEESRDGEEDEDEDEGEEKDESFQPGDMMKLQLEVLEGNMKNAAVADEDERVEEDEEDEEEETVAVTKVNGEDSLVMHASVLNGDDDYDEDDEHQLSIDMPGEPEEEEVVRPSIRVARGLTVESPAHHPLTNGTKRKAVLSSQATLPVKKARPSVVETELEVKRLEEEVRALQWMARRKEQEWDQIVRLLKQKEERLMRCQRSQVLALTETEHLVAKLGPVVVPQQQVLLLATQPLRPAARSIAPKPAAPATPTLAVKPRSSPASKVASPAATETVPITPVTGQEETKFSAVLERASKNLAKATKGKEEEGKAGRDAGKKEKVTPACQGCSKRKSEFVCAGCSNRWYCSRECQVEDWDEHADDCSG